MFGKEDQINKVAKTPPPDLAEGNSFSDDFRETLRRSGLDTSAFQGEKSETETTLNIDSPLSEMPATEADQTALKKSKTVPRRFAPKFRWRQSHLLAIAAIIAIIIFQFVFQFSLGQEENLRVAERLIGNDAPLAAVNTKAGGEIPQIKTNVEIEPRTPTKLKTEFVSQPKIAASESSRELRAIPVKAVLRKKEVRESAAERLRRAERILTGI